MSAQNAKDAADDVVAGIASQLARAEGLKFQLVTFNSEEDCRFFYPRRALDFHRQVNTYISRALRERFGVRVQRIALAIDDFEQWDRQRPRAHFINDGPPPKAPTPREFADSHLRLL